MEAMSSAFSVPLLIPQPAFKKYRYSSNTHARWHLLASEFLSRLYKITKTVEDKNWEKVKCEKWQAKGQPGEGKACANFTITASFPT